ncbi:TetR/AcrR family transcriptional regulator C-terminal domain-containing protein [Actinoplanes sp. NPDC051851]|uniref:TetR/AcrR family transcriptional regulator C-terminal domain-containing protein n=1 Tax=Actinoplanes sp. NPDC051851 TaxID=3154753 RepID=UPI0034499D2E
MQPTSRRRGRPPRLSRERIVAVARAMDPETLTMQAVAAELGVDRKALNYHVADREGLLELVAFDVIQGEMARRETAEVTDWREATRAFATANREGLLKTGTLFEYVRMPAAEGLAALAPAERYARTLLAAGFTEEQACRAIAMLGEIVFVSARDAILAGKYRGHPQVTEMRRMFAEAAPDQLPTMRRLIELRDESPERQFQFDVDIFIAGLESLLG